MPRIPTMRRFAAYLGAKYHAEIKDAEIEKHYMFMTLRDIARVNMDKPDKYPTFQDYKAMVNTAVTHDDGVDYNDIFDAEMANLVEQEEEITV